jgi:hypothetical protein
VGGVKRRNENGEGAFGEPIPKVLKFEMEEKKKVWGRQTFHVYGFV